MLRKTDEGGIGSCRIWHAGLRERGCWLGDGSINFNPAQEGYGYGYGHSRNKGSLFSARVPSLQRDVLHRTGLRAPPPEVSIAPKASCMRCSFRRHPQQRVKLTCWLEPNCSFLPWQFSSCPLRRRPMARSDSFPEQRSGSRSLRQDGAIIMTETTAYNLKQGRNRCSI